jgi:hypothetical protein
MPKDGEHKDCLSCGCQMTYRLLWNIGWWCPICNGVDVCSE